MDSSRHLQWMVGGDNVEAPEEALVCFWPENEDEDGPIPCGSEEWVVIRDLSNLDSVSLMLMCTECNARVSISTVLEGRIESSG